MPAICFPATESEQRCFLGQLIAPNAETQVLEIGPEARFAVKTLPKKSVIRGEGVACGLGYIKGSGGTMSHFFSRGSLGLKNS